MGGAVAVRVDRLHEMLRLLIGRRIDVPQEILEGKRLRADDNGPIPRILTVAQVVAR